MYECLSLVVYESILQLKQLHNWAAFFNDEGDHHIAWVILRDGEWGYEVITDIVGGGGRFDR